jgi:hypothetical protein
MEFDGGQWIKENKQAVGLTRLSCHRFRAGRGATAVERIAHNLGNLWGGWQLPAN